MNSTVHTSGANTAFQLSLLSPIPLLAGTSVTESPFGLHDYQKRVIQELKELYKQGYRRPFVYAPTGSGKTVIAARILANAVGKKRRCLFLVHRDALVEQTQEALAIYNIQAGIIKAGYKENRQLDIQIASIQSLQGRQFPDGIDVIVIDECHTTCWYKTFESVKERYPRAFFIGLTATPWRSKPAEYMGQHFDSIVQAPSVAELITTKYLVLPRYFGFGGLIDIAEIDNGEDGDFDERQMQRACMKTGFNERIVEEYSRLARERTAIVFCSGVEQSKLVNKLFNKANITCEHLEADTNHQTRKAMYARLKSGQTRILSSVNTLTEGFDVRAIGCVILARPTRSRALLFQMAGRGLRTHKNKHDCLMLDFGENFSRLGFLTAPQPIQLGSLKRRPEEQPTMIKECPSCHEMISIFARICPFCGFEFTTEEFKHEEDVEELDSEMGELFPKDQKAKLKYLRSEIRRLYKQKSNVDQLWELFEKRWGHHAPNEWHKGAVFGKRNTEANRHRYLDYLNNVNPNPKNSFWVKFHMELEFGKQRNTSERERQRQSQKQRASSRKYPVDDDFPKAMNWWNILGVQKTDTKADIKTAYRRLAREYHPDCQNMSPEEANEKMQLLNWAYEEAESHFS